MATDPNNNPTKFHRELAGRILRMGKKAGEPVLAGALPSPDEIAAIVNDFLSVILPGTRRTRLGEGFSDDDARDRLAEVIADLEVRLEAALYLTSHRLHSGKAQKREDRKSTRL